MKASVNSHSKLFDFPRAVTPAPPVPERNHPIHKHIRAQSEGHTIVNNVSPFNVTAARRTQSTFTKASPNGHGVALLSTHSESRGESDSPPDSPLSGTRTGTEAPANANPNANSMSTSTPTSPASGTRSSRSSRSRRQKSGSLSSTRQDAPQPQALARSSLSSPVASSGKVRLQLGLPPKSSPRSSPRRANRTLPNTQSQQSPQAQYTSNDPTPAPSPPVSHPSPPTQSHSLPATHTPDTITPSLEAHSTSTSTSAAAPSSTFSPAAETELAEAPPPIVDHTESSPFPTQSSVVDESVGTPLFSDPPFPSSDDVVTRPISSSTLDTIPLAATFHEDHSHHSNHADPNS